ncbi:MAG: DNA replication and repair protein RecF [Abyssibacter sp.]|uniref:DNA replication/repair protein RecF n=1 Tax=Abyssibacter sp. TaxID=2320200 RepID=UPI00321A3A13
MLIQSLALTDFRCHASLHLALQLDAPAGGVALIGDNASGKTSILEAIYLLSRGVSFRGSSPSDVIRHGQAHALVVAATQQNGQSTRLAVQRSRSGFQARLDSRSDVTVLDLARAFPVQVMDPRAHRLIDEGPVHRRRMLDWGVFHVEHTFIQEWRQFQRLLRQRNAACRRGDQAQLRAWNPAFIELGERVDAARQRHLEALAGSWRQRVNTLLDGEHHPLIAYRPGWPRQLSLAEALAQSEQRELEAGYSVIGPHRADVRLQLDGRQVRHQASRGQQKALVLALLLAQLELVAESLGHSPILLIDDFSAEWGAGMRERAVAQLQQGPAQWISTWLDAPESSARPAQMFHVEHLSHPAP